MAIYQNTPMPQPGQIGHDDEGIPHLNVPGEGLVPLPPSLHPMDLQVSPMGQTGGAPAPMPSNAPEMQPSPIAKNDMGLAIVNDPVARNAPAAPFNAPVDTSAQPAAPMMPQIQTIKESKTESKKIRSEDKAQMDKTNEALANAIHADANAQAAKSNAEATLLDSHALELQQQNTQMKEAEDRRQAAVAERMADVDKEIAKQASMSVDPNYFGRQDTAAKIATSVGILLSGIGAGWGGGENMALEQVNKAIDRDIDAQKANIAKQGAVVAAKRGGYQDFLNATQDQRAAELAEHNRQSEIFKTRLEQVSAKTNDPIIKAAADKNIAAINAQQANNVAQIQAVTTDQGTKKAVSLGQGGKAGVNGRIPGELANKQIQQRQALAELESLRERLNNPKITSQMGPVKGRVGQKSLEAGTQGFVGEDAAKFDADSKAILGTVVKSFANNPSDSEREFVKSYAPTGLNQTPDLAKSRVDQLINRVKRQQEITDSVVNDYRTGKLVSGDSEPKP